MITLTSQQQTLLASAALVRRLFLTIDTTNSSGGAPQTIGFWDGKEDITLSSQLYQSLGGQPEKSATQQVLDGSIPGSMLTVSGVPGTPLFDMIVDESRRWHQRPATVWLGLYDPLTMAIVGPLIALERGYFDKATVIDGVVGEESTLQIAIESAAREMTRTNPAVRSRLDQLDRFAGDEGFEFVGRDVKVEWGVEQKKHKQKGKRGNDKRGKR